MIACGLLLAASVSIDWGPGNDKAQAGPLLDDAAANLPGAGVLYADAGYDAERVHAQSQ